MVGSSKILPKTSYAAVVDRTDYPRVPAGANEKLHLPISLFLGQRDLIVVLVTLTRHALVCRARKAMIHAPSWVTLIPQHHAQILPIRGYQEI